MGSRSLGDEGQGEGFHFEPLALGLVGAGILWLVADNIQRRWRRTPDGGSAPARGNGEFYDRPRRTERAEESVADFVAANPLLAGLAGLALGAVLGVLLPPSRHERERIVRAREDLWQKAETLGHRTAARIRDIGRCSGAAHPPATE